MVYRTLLAVTLCATAYAAAPPVVVAFGDSITLGVHLAAADTYPAQLERLLRERTGDGRLIVVNSGVGGNTVVAGLARLDREVLAYHPRFVLIGFGMNDSVQTATGRAQVPLEVFTKSLTEMVERTKAAGGTPLLATITPVVADLYFERHPREAYPDGLPAVLAAYTDAIRKVAAATGAEVVDLGAKVPLGALRTPENSGSRDGVHLTPAGCAAVAQAYAEVLVPRLKAAAPMTVTRLESAGLAAELDDATGQVLTLTDRADGRRLLLPSPDRYALQPDPKTEVTADESDDTVVRRDGDTWVATNPKLPGVTITKRYVLTDGWLEKWVAFGTARPNAGLFKHTVTTSVDPGFYRDGYLNDPARHPLDYPYVHTRDLTGERPMRDSHAVADHHWAILTSPATGRGLAQYRFKVDDRYVHLLSSYAYEPGLTYGPAGWRVAVACQWLSRGRPGLVDTCRWQRFTGDHLRFHQDYLALPEVRAEYAFASPAWLGQVRRVMPWIWGSSSFDLTPYREALEALDGGVMMVTIGGVFANTRCYLADPIVNAEGDRIPAAELRKLIDGLHAISPRIKVGPVTWQWGFGPADPVYREHPEWTVHDGDDQPAFAATGWSDEKVFSQLLTPACREYDLAQYRGAIDRFDFDFIYMDTGQGGVTRFDWTTHTGAQDYDWADFYRGIREAARAHRDGAAFFNGTPQLYSQQADCGYFEGMGFVKPRDWRAMADRLLLVKLYQPGEKWTIPLYWSDENLDQYLNYCLLLGLKAGDFGGINSERRWPGVEAADELAAMRLVPEADARPCWWKEATEAEVYALRLPGGAMLNVYQHAATRGAVTASCRVQPLGLDPAKPIRAWLFEPRPAHEVLPTVALTEADAHALFRREGNAPYRIVKATYLGAPAVKDGRVEVKLELDPQRIGLVLLTQAPALASAVDGRPTQLLLPPPPGPQVETIPADQPEPAALVARRYAWQVPEGVRSAALVPERSSPATMRHTERAVGRTIAGLRVDRLLIIECEHNRQNTATADALTDRVRLAAAMGNEKLAGFASAGVEGALGKVTLHVAAARPVYGRLAKSMPGAFYGLVADYHTPAGYTQRVRIALGPCRPEVLASARPWWGLFTDTGAAPKMPLWVDLAGKVPLGGEADLEIDLGATAPADWDGQVLFGPAVDCCGLGTGLTVDLLGNAPAGPRDPKAFSALATGAAEAGTPFQGAVVKAFEDGAKLVDGRIVFPPNGLIEGSGFRVVTWRIQRAPTSQAVVLMVNYQLADRTYKLVTKDLGSLVKPGSEAKFDLDLGQSAPEGWNGRVRLRLRGDGIEAALLANSTFQLF